jgi:hypothetical protein
MTNFELDHFFICTDIGAPTANSLVEFGLVEGSSNIHLGQGTSNRRFFFHNTMLELLWVDNPEAAKSEPIRRTRLWERWSDRDRICPFGICLRPSKDSGNSVSFSSWAYHPPYLPETVSIAIGTNSEVLTEPMLFQIPFGKLPDQALPERTQPLEHPVGLREITRVEIVRPVATPPSPELQSLVDTQLVNLRVGTDYRLELGFDREVQGQQFDFQPELPLTLSW